MRWAIFIPGITLLYIVFFQYLHIIFQGKKERFKIDPFLKIKALNFEFRYTAIALFIFLIVGFFTAYAIDQGFTRVYKTVDWSLSEMLFLGGSFLLAVAIHDIYFYCIHRLLHTRYLFKKVHGWHHRSHNANPWAAFSFHPLESVLQIAIVPLLAFTIPLHENVLVLFTAFLLFMSVYGHSAYELRSQKKAALKIFNTSLHHFQHHRFVNYNFGIYFNLWDRLFSTNHPGYEKAFEQLGKRISDNKPK